MGEKAREQLVRHLADAHAIEVQALAQLRSAPAIAGEPRLIEAFKAHEPETAGHVEMVAERLAAYGEGRSASKDVAGAAGGRAMVLFALVQPDTPGKLTAHAYSYEHMELAAYELLSRAAKEVGDERTAAVASRIGEEEREMAMRLASCFDVAVEASLEGSSEAAASERLETYLQDAHAIERQATRFLRSATGAVADDVLALFLSEHAEESEQHERRLGEALAERGSGPSRIKDAALRLGGLNLGAFFGAQPDATVKIAGFAFAFEHLEIAAYEMLKRVARAAGDSAVAELAERTLASEREAAAAISTTWDRAVRRAYAI